MDSSIYFSLFLVLVSNNPKQVAIYYLSADLQEPKLFRKRAPLSDTARRAGWQGFVYETGNAADRFVRLI